MKSSIMIRIGEFSLFVTIALLAGCGQAPDTGSVAASAPGGEMPMEEKATIEVRSADAESSSASGRGIALANITNVKVGTDGATILLCGNVVVAQKTPTIPVLFRWHHPGVGNRPYHDYNVTLPKVNQGQVMGNYTNCHQPFVLTIKHPGKKTFEVYYNGALRGSVSVTATP